MLIFIILGIIGISSVLISIIFYFIKKNKKKIVLPLTPPAGITSLTIENVTPKEVNIITGDYKLYKEFLNEYDKSHDFKFNGVSYRKGAVVTCPFGLAQGFKVKPDNSLEWGYVRIHSGVDRFGGGNVGEIKDVVLSPYNFEKSWIQEFGNTSYGTLISLLSEKYQFEFRIAHMHQKTNISAWTLAKIKAGEAIKKDWLIGTAGTYGYSSGNHTHTEIRSIDEACEVIELLIEQRFGDQALKEYGTEEILAFYKTQSWWKNKTEKEMLQDWNAQKKAKQIIFGNKYFYRRTYIDNKVHTWYNTWDILGL